MGNSQMYERDVRLLAAPRAHGRYFFTFGQLSNREGGSTRARTLYSQMYEPDVRLRRLHARTDAIPRAPRQR